MEFLSCIFYLGFLGIVSYPVGRIISWFDLDPNSFLFRAHPWELSGRIYEKLNIKSWQARVPDISKVLGDWMPRKKLEFGITPEKVRIMIRETCTAEAVHGLLNIAGLRLLSLWSGFGGVLIYLIYFLLGNLPFIIVQRYNRPRLIQLQEHLELKAGNTDPDETAPLP